ncbi:PTS beta-glucoside transporter subunit IIABC [Lactococcus piscium]|uniref:PTS beta-glucoside transporter subunit IIABC n=1 Tax=Pseudolactococcus piscium TaxID=1364 RepID=A0A2A5S0Q6_9LACT|nr:glucose PTS transporter subunit IIA [Lactococcus piscium]PCS07072.1 PTS beta-glucoside transporter subunit IIABC [Lactococcus piscium]
MDVKHTATQIIKYVGGKKNIRHLEYYATRLLFTLKDNCLVDIAQLEALDRVIGVEKADQCQIIIGNGSLSIYDELLCQLNDLSDHEQDMDVKDKKWGADLLDFVMSIFQPLLPAVFGGSILKSILLFSTMLGLISTTNETYQLLYIIAGAPLYLLPILVAITTANKLKVNQIVAVSLVGALLLPDLTTRLSEGAKIMGVGIENVPYGSQVLPAILAVLLYAEVEQFLIRVSPKPLRTFFAPMICLLIIVPFTLLVLGPFGYNMGSVLSAVIFGLYAHIGWLAVAILAAVAPFMVVTGMHKAMVPYASANLAKTGSELLYLPASLAHNISEAGASFAVALKTKDGHLKSTALFAGISALFGFTEPALYSVTVFNKRVLYSVMFSSFIGGGIAGFFTLRAFAILSPGIASIRMFINRGHAMNLRWAMVALVASFIISFITVLVVYQEDRVSDEVKRAQELETTLTSPVAGKVIALSDVTDKIFLSSMVNKGIAIIPGNGDLLAPIDGVISILFPTQNALVLITEDGAEILCHIGVDTVQLSSSYFSSDIKQGDQVKQGQRLIHFDLKKMKRDGHDTTVICLVTNLDTYEVEPHNISRKVATSQAVLTLIPNEQ